MNLVFWERRIRQLTQVFYNRIYRAVLKKRLLLAGLNKFAPQASLIGLTDSDLTVLYHSNDRAISVYALALGNYHKKEIAETLQLAEGYGAKLGKIMIEVGANIGSTTVSAMKLNKLSKIIAFEPVPDNVRLIKANLALNGFDSSVIVEPFAISDHEGEEEMILSSHNLGDNRIKRNAVGAGQGLFNESEWNKTKVQTICLDSYCKQHNIDSEEISIIWIDAQGFEGYILKGAEQLLSKKAFPVLIEFWPKALQESGCFDLLCEVVEKHFTAFHDVHSNEKRPVKDIRETASRLKNENFSDLLLIP